ncbi:fatty acid desaturase family protein [Pirellulaceae bacterium SH449]
MEVANFETSKFSIRQAKELIKDLHKPDPKIYWADFLLTITAGHALFTLNVHTDKWLSTGLLGTVAIKGLIGAATVVLFLRAAMFTHELVHLPKEGWGAFRVVWNVLCGIPFMIPSFTYYPHIDHHRRKSYGTEEDGEYLNLSHQPPSAIVWYMLGTLVTPFVALIRWGILTPIAWVFPQIRRWTFARASTMVMDISYVRPEAGEKVYRIMRLQEAACLIVAWFIMLHGPLIAKTWLDPFWFHAYGVSVAMIMLNNIRTLGAHRWTGEGSELTFEQQLLDSCDYPNNPVITELWGPTGTRYHATHHLFPSLPYHNLGKAHRRLIAGLPQDSIFRETVKHSLIAEIIELWRRSSAVHSEKPQQSEVVYSARRAA